MAPSTTKVYILQRATFDSGEFWLGIGFSKHAALALKTAIAIGETFNSEIFLVNELDFVRSNT
jgi:hypothetical protein